MTDEEEEKMKKMRVRIERDAYSVLLSFKDGASPSQVERRMDETLGYTYHNKYYLAGVYDMSQILREHHQVRTTSDGKFKIIANEDNQDLVALISKQKENKKKRGGGGQRGRRPMTVMGHHHRSSYGGGLVLRSSPKVSTGMRPFNSMGKPGVNRLSSINNASRQFSSPNGFGFNKASGSSKTNSETQHYPFGSASNSSFASGKTPIPPPSIQRPLVRPPSISSASTSSLPQMSTVSTIRAPSPALSTAQHSTGHMPSIKEFTDNAKRMMLLLHPKSVHLSEMTERYSQEYDVTVEPLQLFSKSWMMLVKSTFKECFQINNGEVSLKEDWFQKYGAAMKRTLVQKQKSNTNQAVKKPDSPVKQAQPLIVPVSLPSNQGFRYQVPTKPKSPLEVVSSQFKALTMASRPPPPTPEKPPGLVPRSSPKESSTMLVDLFPDRKVVSKPSTSTQIKVNLNSTTNDANYDARQLQNLKFVEKSGHLKENVDAALNGREIPELKKTPKRGAKSAVKNIQHVSHVTLAINSQVTPKVSWGNTKSDISCVQRPLTIPDRSRSRTIPDSALSSRIFARAITDIHKQNDSSSRLVEVEPKQLYVAPDDPTSKSFAKDMGASTSKQSDSDDGWAIPTVFKKKFQAPTALANGRKLLLPPMSKGNVNAKLRPRSRPVSITRSMSSQDGMNATIERAINATLPDDDQW